MSNKMENIRKFYVIKGIVDSLTENGVIRTIDDLKKIRVNSSMSHYDDYSLISKFMKNIYYELLELNVNDSKSEFYDAVIYYILFGTEENINVNITENLHETIEYYKLHDIKRPGILSKFIEKNSNIYCINCNNCDNCCFCNNCNDCDNCSLCNNCNNCDNCSFCDYCNNCDYCNDCYYCNNCNSCGYSDYCNNCFGLIENN